MQTALYIAQDDATREQYTHNTQKTKTITVNANEEEYTYLLNNEPIGTSKSEKHLGIHRNSSNTNINTIEARIKDARRTAYSLLGAELCGLNDSGIEVCLTL